ncbi:hypothetical protein [Streptomyces sp. NPDC056144]|uniref:hypothetical protein n=1 Tax=unclassified Streptomyces TaxID=2593676 RepID=UPI0035DE4C5B
MSTQDLVPSPVGPVDVEQAEAALVERYPRLVRIAYLVLPPSLGRNRRVLTAHALVQRSLPRRRVPGPSVPAPRRTEDAVDPGYAYVRGEVLRQAIVAGLPLRRRALPRRAQFPPLLPQVWGLRVFPRVGGADELALDQRLSALSGPGRAAYVLRGLERQGDAEVLRVLAAAGVTDPAAALAEADALDALDGADGAERGGGGEADRRGGPGGPVGTTWGPGGGRGHEGARGAGGPGGHDGVGGPGSARGTGGGRGAPGPSGAPGAPGAPGRDGQSARVGEQAGPGRGGGPGKSGGLGRLGRLADAWGGGPGRDATAAATEGGDAGVGAGAAEGDLGRGHPASGSGSSVTAGGTAGPGGSGGTAGSGQSGSTGEPGRSGSTGGPGRSAAEGAAPGTAGTRGAQDGGGPGGASGHGPSGTPGHGPGGTPGHGPGGALGYGPGGTPGHGPGGASGYGPGGTAGRPGGGSSMPAGRPRPARLSGAALLESAEFDPCSLQARPTDLLRRRQHLRAAAVGVVALAACGALLGLPGDGWGRNGAAAPSYARNPAAEAALDPAAVRRVPAGAWTAATRRDFSVWPARGPLVADRALLRRALAVWARPGLSVTSSATPGTPVGPPMGSPQLLFAGLVDGARVVLFHDGLRAVRYAEPVEGTDGAALDFARTDAADEVGSLALVVSRASGNVRYLTAPWAREVGVRDLLSPAKEAWPLARDAQGVTEPMPSPAAQAKECARWNTLQVRDGSGTRLLSDLGELAPARLLWGAPDRPVDATGPDARQAWARTACGLSAARGHGVRSVNAWRFARQPLPERAGQGAWVCSRAETWRGTGGRALAQFLVPDPKVPAAVAAHAENSASCGVRDPRVLAGVLWRAPGGSWYVLAAGSDDLASVEATGGVRGRADGSLLAVRATAGARADLRGTAEDGMPVAALR